MNVYEIAPWLYVGTMPEAEDAPALHDRGITHVVDVSGREGGVTHLDHGFRGLRLICDDPPRGWQHGDVRTQGDGWYGAAIGFAIGALAENPSAKVLVHCWAGSERSPSLALAMLVAIDHRDPTDALALVRGAIPHAGISYRDEAARVGMFWFESFR